MQRARYLALLLAAAACCAVAAAEPTCSCANPQPVPLQLNNVPASGAVYAAGGQSAAADDKRCDAAAEPRCGAGADCGAGIGICKAGHCCSQSGVCSKAPDACDGTCQCQFSGAGSGCRGSYPFPLPSPLPVAKPGRLCGEYVASCPAGECCTQFGFCVPDGNVYCGKPSCVAAASLLSSSACGTAARALASKADSVSTAAVAPAWQRGRRVRRFDWTVTWKQLSLDGFARQVIVVNGETFPAIEVNVNDRIIVKVTNKLTKLGVGAPQPLSIHWHGMLQRRTNIMDGVVPVTQRPVQSGECFTYDFIADTAGTFWWHSHYKTQYLDGLWGPLIIRDPTAPALPADEIVAINDWYHQLAAPLTAYYLSPVSQGNEPVPYDALLNGCGQGYCLLTGKEGCTVEHIKGVAADCSNPKTKLRFINSGGFAVFNVSIDDHRMIVVAEDGSEIEPIEVGSFQINNGQRYDVLVCQRPGAPLRRDPVWIRAVMIDANFASPSKFNTTLGVLYYRASDAEALPTSTSTPGSSLPALTPSQSGAGYINPYVSARMVGGLQPPGPADVVLEPLVIDFYNEPPTATIATQFAHFSNISLNMDPLSPSLLERYSNNPEDLPPPANPPVPPGGRGWNVIDVPLGKVVDIVIQNHDTGEHPIHVHGQWWWVLDAGLPNAGDYVYDPRKPLNATLARDTVTVNLKSYLVLRVLAVNPGLWILHCHIDWHLAGGLGLVLRQGFPKSP